MGDTPTADDLYSEGMPEWWSGEVGQMMCLDCLDTWDGDGRQCACGSEACGQISDIKNPADIEWL